VQFAPDTEETLAFLVSLCNTDASASRSGDDELLDEAALADFFASWRFSGRHDGDSRELRDVRATRDRFRALWHLDRDEAVEQVNAMLRDAKALPYLIRHDGSDWHLHATDLDAPLGERFRVEVALALVDVIRSDAWSRLRVCDADDCEGVLIDLSRNGSKRFCSVRCGNRMNQIAFRERAEA
jgi:predicted RNA-binding Zn ribbon-like protein